MASDIQICNLALTMLGQAPISSLSQSVPRAEKCNAVYETLRDVEIASHNWRFATEYVLLTQLDEEPDFGYNNVFQLPNDYAKLIRLDSELVEYRIVGNKLYTDEDEIGLEYVKKVTNAGEFSDFFVDLLAARLAKELAWGITNNRTLSIDMAENYNIVRRRAIGLDSQIGTPRKLYRNKMEEARK